MSAEIGIDLTGNHIDTRIGEGRHQRLQPPVAGPLVVVDEGDQLSRRLGHAAVAGKADAGLLLQDMAQRHAPQGEGGLPALDDRASFRQGGIVDHQDLVNEVRGAAAHPLPDQAVQAGAEQFGAPMGADDDADRDPRISGGGALGGRHDASVVSDRHGRCAGPAGPRR